MKPFYQDNLATIYNGDALKVLKDLPDESVQMCMTSPPYWGLRNYANGANIVWGDNHCDHEWLEETYEHQIRTGLGLEELGKKYRGGGHRAKGVGEPTVVTQGFCTKCGAWLGQLGLEPNPELYIEHLMMIFREVKRVLPKDGSFYLNIGDTYAGSGCAYGSPPDPKWPTARNNQDKKLKPRQFKDLPAKCMICIPERVLFAMLQDGWILRNKIIWWKPNNMPSSTKDRFAGTWEYLYFFTKSNITLLWRNEETGEWRDIEPTKEEKYPLGGRYRHYVTGELRWDKPPEDEVPADWEHLNPVWHSFDYYFELDAVREPHKTQSLERYQRGVNLGRPAEGKSGEVGPMQQYIRAPEWFQQIFPPDGDYKGKFDDLFGHGPNAQSFNLRVRDFKRGKKGTSAQSGELKASEQEIENYEYPEKHHGSPMNNVERLHRGRDGSKYADMDNPQSIRVQGGHTGDQIHPKGKNPGDLWSIATKPSSISVCPKCETVFPRLLKVCPHCNLEGIVGHFAPYPEALCIDPIKASSRVGDIILDIFAGGGTTGVAAKRLGRQAILIDCVRPYCVMARYKLQRVEYQPEIEYSLELSNVLDIKRYR